MQSTTSWRNTLFGTPCRPSVDKRLRAYAIITSTPFKADTWTNLGAIRELAAMFLGSFFLIESMLESAPPHITIGVALSFATFTGTGSAYSHYELDRQHQGGEASHNPETNAVRLSLSSQQIFMLIITAIGQAGDFVGFPDDMLDLEAAGLLNTNYLIIINIALLILGLAAAWAEVRACKIAMEINNGVTLLTNENPNKHIDRWSLFSLIIKTIQVFLTSILFWAKVSDTFFGADEMTPMKVSIMGLIYALPLTLVVTYCMVFYQYFINVNNQGHFNSALSESLESQIEEEDDQNSLETRTNLEKFWVALKKAGILQDDSAHNYAMRFEKLMLLGRLLGTATEFSEELTFLLTDFFTPQWLPLILITCLTVGLILSVSDARTAANNLKDYRKEHPADNILSSSCCNLFNADRTKSNAYAAVTSQI